MKYLSLFFIAFIISGCSDGLFMERKAGWDIKLLYFEEYKREARKDNAIPFWKYSYIDLGSTGLTAALGPNSYKNEGYHSFTIDIERPDPVSGYDEVGRPITAGSQVLAMLEMDLKYVGKVNILKDASEMITFDEQAGLVTFDLGNNSVFIYQISEFLDSKHTGKLNNIKEIE